MTTTASGPAEPQEPTPKSVAPVHTQELTQHVVEIVCDSGEGAQTAGQLFGTISARMGNGVWTVEIIPAEIEPPHRSRSGASGNRIRIGSSEVTNMGDEAEHRHRLQRNRCSTAASTWELYGPAPSFSSRASGRTTPWSPSARSTRTPWWILPSAATSFARSPWRGRVSEGGCGCAPRQEHVGPWPAMRSLWARSRACAR